MISYFRWLSTVHNGEIIVLQQAFLFFPFEYDTDKLFFMINYCFFCGIYDIFLNYIIKLTRFIYPIQVNNWILYYSRFFKNINFALIFFLTRSLA